MTPWYLEASLAGAYQALTNLDPNKQFNRKAVMLFYDRDFNVSPTNGRAAYDCTGARRRRSPRRPQALAGPEPHRDVRRFYLANADFDLPDGGVYVEGGGPSVRRVPAWNGGVPHVAGACAGVHRGRAVLLQREQPRARR